MPVKNKNRQSNSGYEGVITGLNDKEKKVLEDAGIGGGMTIKSFNPTLTFKRIENTDEDLLISVDFESNISTEIENYVESLISSNKIFNINALIKAESYERYRFVLSGNTTFYDFAHFSFSIKFFDINFPGTNEYVELSINEGQMILHIKVLQQYYSQFKQLVPLIFTNNTVIKVSVISYD